MGRKKVKYREEFNWIKDLKKNEYTFMIMPKGNSKKFYATKAAPKKNGTPSLNAGIKWDEYTLEQDEKWIPGKDAKNVFIRL